MIDLNFEFDNNIIPSSVQVDNRNLLSGQAIDPDIIRGIAEKSGYHQDSDRLPFYGDETNRLTEGEPITNKNIEELQERKAENQGGLEQLRNALVQGVVGVAGIGALEGFADLYDIITGAAARSIYKDAKDNLDDGSENFTEASQYLYRNAVSAWLHDKRDELNAAFPIYSDKEYTIGSGGLAHWSWYMQNLPSIFSFISFAIPSGATTKLLSMTAKGIKGAMTANKIAKGAKALNALDKVEDAAETALRAKAAATSAVESGSAAAHVARALDGYASANLATELGNTTRVFTGVSNNTGATVQLLTNGILGTAMANQMFARDVAYKKQAELREAFADEDVYRGVIERNPSLQPYANDKEAVINILANRAATRDWEYNIITGIPITSQLAAMRGWYRGVARKGANRAIAEEARVAGESLITNAEKAAAVQAFNNSTRGKLTHFFWTDRDFSWGSNFRGYWDAAWGNAVNVIGEFEADYDAKSNLTGQNEAWGNRIPTYFTEGRLWDAAVWGTQIFQNRIKRIQEGVNINEYRLDENGKYIPNPKYNPVPGESYVNSTEEPFLLKEIESDAERELVMKKEYDRFRLDVIDHAASNSNLGVLESFFSDENVKQSFVDAGLMTKEEANEFAAETKKVIKEYGSEYGAQLNRFINLGINPYISQILASQNMMAIYNSRNTQEVVNRYNGEIEREIALLREDSNFNETEYRRGLDAYKRAIWITQLRNRFRTRLNAIADEKGLDFQIERERLTKVIDLIENHLYENAGLSREDIDTLKYFSRKTKRQKKDDRGNLLFDTSLNPIYETYTKEADDYLASRIEEYKKAGSMTEEEAEGYRSVIESRKNEINDLIAKFTKVNSSINQNLLYLVKKEIEKIGYESMIDSNDADIYQRAQEVYTKVDKKAREQIDNATRVLYDMMKKYDTDQVYDYIMRRPVKPIESTETTEAETETPTEELDTESGIKGMTVSDKKALEDAIFLSGLTQKTFNSIAFDIAQKYDAIKEEARQSKKRETAKAEAIARRKRIKGLEHKKEDGETPISNEEKTKLKVGDNVVFTFYVGPNLEGLTDEQILELDETKDESPDNNVSLKGKIVEIKPVKVNYFKDKNTGEVFTFYGLRNREKDALIEAHPEYEFDESREYPNEKTYIVEVVDGATKQRFSISSNNVNFKAKNTLVEWSKKSPAGSKKSKGTKGSPKKKVAADASKKAKSAKYKVGDNVELTDGRKGIVNEVYDDGTFNIKIGDSLSHVNEAAIKGLVSKKKDSSTGGAIDGNTIPGGVINEGDAVYLLDDDGEVVAEGTFAYVKLKKGTIQKPGIQINGKGRTKESDLEHLARKEGYIEVKATDTEDYDEAKSFASNVATQIIGEKMAEYAEDLLDGISLDKLNRIRNEVKANKPDVWENEEGEPESISISDEDWNEAVDELIDAYNNLQTEAIARRSTLSDFIFINNFKNNVPTTPGEVSSIYDAFARRLINEYIKTFEKDFDITDDSKHTTIDFVDLLNYIYSQTKDINKINQIYSGLYNYLRGTNLFGSSNVTISFATFSALNRDQLYEAITKDAKEVEDNSSPEIIEKFNIIDILSMYNTAHGTNLTTNEIVDKLDLNKGLSIRETGDALTFTSADGTVLGSIPYPRRDNKTGYYTLKNDGWKVDVGHDGYGIRSEFLEDYVNTWFTNENGTYSDLIGLIEDWIKLTVDDRNKFNTKGTIAYNLVQSFKNLIDTDSRFQNVDLFFDKTYKLPAAADKQRLDYLRKLYEFSAVKRRNGNTLEFNIYNWRDRLYYSAQNITDVYNDAFNESDKFSKNYYAEVVGINPGKLYYGNVDDRGFADERLAGYNNNPNDFKIGVASVDGLIDVSGELLPQRFMFAGKGQTYCVLPYQGAGLRNYVQAYPVSVSSLFEDNSTASNVPKQIVNDIKTELYNLIIEKMKNPTDENFVRLKDFLLSVFWNRANWNPSNNTAYSLFRLRPEAKEGTSFKYLTASETTGNKVTLTVGKLGLIVSNTRDFNSGEFGANVISINGKPIGPKKGEGITREIQDNIKLELDNIFNNISFDININFIKSDGQKSKKFGNSLVSRDTDGKFVITIPTAVGIPKTYTFDSYSRFLTDNHLVTFKTKITPSGTNYIQTPKDASAMGVEAPDELRQPKMHVVIRKTADRAARISTLNTIENDLVEPVKNIINSKSKTKGYDIVKKILPSIDVSDELKQLFPTEVVIDDSKLEYEEAGEKRYANALTEWIVNTKKEPTNPIVYIGSESTPGSIMSMLKDSGNETSNLYRRQYVARKLIHERLHYLLNQRKNQGNIAAIEGVYDEFKKIVENNEQSNVIEAVARELGKTVAEYRDFLKEALFEDENHTVNGTDGNIDINASKLLRLEEFLIESLTNEELSKALNNLESENVGTKKSNLWTRIMEFLLTNLLNIKNINKKSLYQREINSLKASFSEKIDTFVASENLATSQDIAKDNTETTNIDSNVEVTNDKDSMLKFIDDILGNIDSPDSRFSTLGDYTHYNVRGAISHMNENIKGVVESAIEDGYINLKCTI